MGPHRPSYYRLFSTNKFNHQRQVTIRAPEGEGARWCSNAADQPLVQVDQFRCRKFRLKRSRKCADAYALLSRYAKARMSFNQFSPAEDDATYQQYEQSPYDNVTAEQFAYLMQYVEAARGTPRAPKMLHVFSTDPDVLNRRSKEQFGAMDSMFAIGAMPEWIPADIRKASLRGQIHAELSSQELQNVAQREGISVEDLKKSDDFDPYFNVKLVLIEEGG